MDFTQRRQNMVREHLYARGVRDRAVLEAMGKVAREAFVAHQAQTFAYEDRPLPIGHGQTISQPYIVAFMLEALALTSTDRLLEIGTGCGYAAAVASAIVDEVYTIERLSALAQLAANHLVAQGCTNVHVRHADGTLGWEDKAPFEAILVSAGGPHVPEALKQQLAIGGRMVIPIGTDQRAQELVRITRVGPDEYDREDLAGVRFVPLVGAQGWTESGDHATPTSPRVV